MAQAVGELGEVAFEVGEVEQGGSWGAGGGHGKNWLLV
jgi:hypothetical protein